jgi:O-antigen/teichoic acid export membrane protein
MTDPAAEPGRPQAGRTVLRSALARVLSFVPTAIATLATSKLIIDKFGVAPFDSFALILALINLIPLNNLGVGAAITSVYAAHGPRSEPGLRTTLTAARVLVVSTAVTAAIALMISALGAWPTLLGSASGPSSYTGIAMALYALSFLPGLGQSMLLGVHRNHVTVVVQTFFTPLVLIGTVAVIVAGAEGSVVMILPPAAILVVNLITLGLAARATGVDIAGVVRKLSNRRRFPGASIRAISGPMLISTTAAPIALQSDRIVLSHVSSVSAVANYSVAMQIFAPGLALIAAAAQPLWPIYERARAEGRVGFPVSRLVALFGGFAVAFGVVLVALARPVGHLIGGDKIDLGWTLPICWGVAVVLAGMTVPVAMTVMDAGGARFFAITAAIALPMNIALSIVLSEHMGAPGPILATVIVGVIVQTVPGYVYVRNRQAVPGRHRLESGRDRVTVRMLLDPDPGEPVVSDGIPAVWGVVELHQSVAARPRPSAPGAVVRPRPLPPHRRPLPRRVTPPDESSLTLRGGRDT